MLAPHILLGLLDSYIEHFAIFCSKWLCRLQRASLVSTWWCCLSLLAVGNFEPGIIVLEHLQHQVRRHNSTVVVRGGDQLIGRVAELALTRRTSADRALLLSLVRVGGFGCA